VTLLSRELSHLAWIAFSFNIIWCWKILCLSCESCVAGHFLFRLIREYPDFSCWYSELIWIFVWIDLGFSSLSGAFFLLSIFSQTIPATWSMSPFVGARNFIHNDTIPLNRCSIDSSLDTKGRSHAKRMHVFDRIDEAQ
jgi:hypothetical protein